MTKREKIDFFDKADDGLDTDEVLEITTLVEMQLKAQKDVEATEEKLKEAKKQLRKIQEGLLPDTMAAAGVEELKLQTGQRIVIEEFVSCSVTKDKKPKVLAYLRGIGSGDLIKNEVSVPFQAGDDDKAQALVTQLDELGFLATQDETVHTGTLKAWIKDRMKEGKPVDKALLGVYVGAKASIK